MPKVFVEQPRLLLQSIYRNLVQNENHCMHYVVVYFHL